MFDDCKKLGEFPDADKTWTNFQERFIDTQQNLRRHQQTSSKQGVFHAYAVMFEEICRANDALVKMAQGVAEDKEQIVVFIHTIAKKNEIIVAFRKGLKQPRQNCTVRLRQETRS